MKRIGLMASEEKSFENVYDGRRTGGLKMDDCLYYKLTYKPGSGELIISICLESGNLVISTFPVRVFFILS